MLLEELRANRKALVELANHYGAHHLRVFGSVARGEERPDSDVDFLVELPQGFDLFEQRSPLAEELEELVQRRVALLPEHELNQHIRERDLKEAMEL